MIVNLTRRACIDCGAPVEQVSRDAWLSRLPPSSSPRPIFLGAALAYWCCTACPASGIVQ
jgi:hypothetical protein